MNGKETDGTDKTEGAAGEAAKDVKKRRVAEYKVALLLMTACASGARVRSASLGRAAGTALAGERVTDREKMAHECGILARLDTSAENAGMMLLVTYSAGCEDGVESASIVADARKRFGMLFDEGVKLVLGEGAQ